MGVRRVASILTEFNTRKYKIPNLQNGHAYLTTHRACYVDNLEPRKSSIAVELKSVDRYEFYVWPDKLVLFLYIELRLIGGLPEVFFESYATFKGC